MSEVNRSNSNASPDDTHTSPSKRSGGLWSRKWFKILAAAVVLGVIVSVLGMTLSGRGKNNISSGRIGVIRRDVMVINSIESGAVEAERKKEIQNDLNYKVIIKEVVDNGTKVNNGDTIIVFECKELTDAISRQKLELDSAKNLYFDASEKLKISEKDLANKVFKAGQGVIDAKEDAAKYEEAEYLNKLAEAQEEVKLRETELLLSQADLDFMLMANNDSDLKENPPYSEKEIKGQMLMVDQKTLNLARGRSNLMMLEKYEGPKKRRQLQAAVKDAGLELERAQITQKTQIMVEQANANSRKNRLEMVQQELEKMEEDFNKLEVKADRSGLVIYKTTRYHWENTSVTVAIGEEIRPRQLLMIIPDMTSLRVTTKVPEAIIEQVRPGQEVIVRLDAKPDVVFTGKIEKVPPVPDAAPWWERRSTKFYTITVKFDEGQSKDLLPEMTATAELILDRIPDVLQAPIAAIFTEQEKTYCWNVNGGSSLEKVPVKIGRMNDSSVEILAGLTEGDRVMLIEPEQMIGPEQEEKSKEYPGAGGG